MRPSVCEPVMKLLCDLGLVTPFSGPSFQLLYNDCQSFGSLEFWPDRWPPPADGDQKQSADNRRLDGVSLLFHASGPQKHTALPSPIPSKYRNAFLLPFLEA